MKRRNLISDINVVPYIDVMLVLLVIFMISAPLMVQGIEVNLPEASSEALPVKNNEPLVVSIKKDGSIYLETDSTKDRSLTIEEMSMLVRKIFENRPGLQVIIRGDGEVKYDRVVKVMAGLQVAGVNDIGLISKPIN
tara:strand:+ start:2198 stop:2608 length:411 start_codon:yes stop_codon:yes gene_type:complete